MPKSLQYGKVSRELGPCGLPRPAQLERENGSERRRDWEKMQSPRCPARLQVNHCLLGAAKAASTPHSPAAALRFQPAQPQKQPLTLARKPRAGGGRPATSKRQTALLAERDTESHTAWVPTH